MRISILMAWSFTISCKTLSSFLRMAFSSGPVQVFGTGFSLWPRYTSVDNSSIRTRVQNEHCFLVVAISLICQMNYNTGAAQKMIENQVNWVTLTRLNEKYEYEGYVNVVRLSFCVRLAWPPRGFCLSKGYWSARLEGRCFVKV